jgi:hypothetical protein
MTFVFTAPIAGGVGFVAGAFCPAIGRKIKALFVKETSQAKAVVSNTLVNAATEVKSVK